MSTFKEEILGRYKETKSETDTFGRKITVHRLRPSQQVAVMKMSETDASSVVTILTTAASVMRIDDDEFSFPRNLAELNSVLDRLEQEGVTAAAKAFFLLSGGKEEEKDGETPAEAAKNSAATPA